MVFTTISTISEDYTRVNETYKKIEHMGFKKITALKFYRVAKRERERER